VLDQVVLPEVLPVVGRDHDERVLVQAEGLETFEKPTDPLVQIRHGPVVLLHETLCELARLPPLGHHVPVEGVEEPRRGILLLDGSLPGPGRHVVGAMGVHVVHEQEERARCVPIQPVEDALIQLR
jgi:hypothetical protein